jgi:hypothetical protein
MANVRIKKPRLGSLKSTTESSLIPGEAAAKSPVSLAGQNDEASERRLRKRESDRKCQRLSRQRKNSRIAYLESLVEQLQEADTSGQLDALVQRISHLQKERDSFEGKLKAIEGILMPAQAQTQDEAEALRTPNAVSAEVQTESAAAAFSLASSEEGTHLPSDLGDSMVSESHNEFLFPLANPLLPEKVDSRKYQNDVPNTWLEKPPMDAPRTTFQRPYLGMPYPTVSTWSTSLLSRRSCECGQARALKVLDRNHWYHGNATLGAWMKWPSPVPNFPDADPDHEDTPIRAVLEGWDAVEHRGNMHPVWRLLRAMDDSLFRYAEGSLNRVGILFGVSRLLLAHMDQSRVLYSKLPPYFLERHENGQYAYASNFLAWPGIRRMLITHEHQYCSNRFWRMFINSMRIRWPFEFRDCYLYNASKALYTISPTFLETLNNIQALGVTRDFLDYYPEFRGLVVAVDEIPPSMTMPSYQYMGVAGEALSSPRQSQHPYLSPFNISGQLYSSRGKQHTVAEHESDGRDRTEGPLTSAGVVATATTTAPTGALNGMLSCIFDDSYGSAGEEHGEAGARGREQSEGAEPFFQLPTWGEPVQPLRQVLLPEASSLFAGSDFYE